MLVKDLSFYNQGAKIFLSILYFLKDYKKHEIRNNLFTYKKF